MGVRRAAKLCKLWVGYVAIVAPRTAGAVESARPDLEHRTQGKQLYRTENYAAAAAAFEAAIAAVPTDADNHAYLANTLFRLGDFERAEKSFWDAIGLKPDEPRYLSNLGSVHVQLKQYDKALEAYAKAIELLPSDGTLQKNYDTTEMLVKVELMLRELDTMQGDYWDLEGFGNGKNYSDKTEVTVRFALERHPEYTTKVINFLKDAVQKEPKFAIMSHILANTLVYASKGQARGTPDEKRLIADATLALSNSINLSYETRARVQQGFEGTCTNGAEESTLRLVAVATSERSELTRLKQSATALGWTVNVLGLGDKWEGLGSKITYLTEYLTHVPCNDLVLFLDAYDVMLLSTAAEIRERFESFKRPIVIGAELGCAPDESMQVLYPKPKRGQPFYFVNSGTYIGYANDVRDMLVEISADIADHHSFTGASKHRLDDQRWFTRHYIRNQQSIAMDVDGIMFHTLHDVEPAQIELVSGRSGVVRSSITDTQPCAIHGNGNGITTFHDISRRLVQAGWPPNSTMDTTASPIKPNLSREDHIQRQASNSA